MTCRSLGLDPIALDRLHKGGEREAVAEREPCKRTGRYYDERNQAQKSAPVATGGLPAEILGHERPRYQAPAKRRSRTAVPKEIGLYESLRSAAWGSEVEYMASAIGDIQCVVLKELQSDRLRKHHVPNGQPPSRCKAKRRGPSPGAIEEVDVHLRAVSEPVLPARNTADHVKIAVLLVLDALLG
jgi:hypothetical protein